jgi:CHAT domain-containing protein
MALISPLRWAAPAVFAAALSLVTPGRAHAADALVSVGDELAVGKNRTGEACRIRLVESRAEFGGLRRYHLFCDGWTQPSGEILTFGVSKSFTPEKVLTETGWAKNLDLRVGGCGAIEPTTLGSGAAAALRECRRLDGGWRDVVVGTIIGSRGYGLETFPTNMPLLEASVEVIEGKRAPADAAKSSGSLSAVMKRAEAMVDASGKLTGVGDVGAHAALYRVGTLRNYAGDVAGSEAAFRRALEIEERAGGPDQPASGRTLSWIALSVGYQSRFEEAERLFNRAEPLVHKSNSWTDRPLYLTYRGSIERYRGRYDVALPLSEEAVRLRDSREQRTSNETSGLAHSLMSLGRVQLNLKKLDEAERSVSRALDIVQRPGQDAEFRSWWASECREWLGRIHIQQKRYADARKQFEASLERRRLLFGDSIKAAESYRSLGELGRIEGNMPAALQAFRKEAEISVADPLVQSRVRPQSMAPYMDVLFQAAAADPAQREALHAEAFAAGQIPREGDTARAITNMAARLDTADPALSAVARAYQEALRKRDRARRELALLTLLPAEKREPAREEQLKQELKAALAEVASREGRLQAEFPRYAGLVAPRPLPLADLKALLKPGEALLATMTTREATYVFLVRDGNVYAHRAAVTAAALDKSVRDLRKGLDLADGQLRDFDVAAAHKIYTDLLGPVSAQLRGATHLIVVPSGPLLSLPLGLLVTQAGPAPAGASPEKKDYRQVAFLGKQLPISVLPSTGSLKSLRAVAGRSKAPQPFIGFGDPAFAGAPGDTRNLAALGNLCRDGGAVDAELVRGLPRLRESAGEMRQIAKALKAPESGVILGAEATEKRVRATDLSQYRVVAFATHGLLPGDLKCKGEPALALTPPATSTAEEDGLLDASEVAQLKLDADWVVLSACNTAAPDGKLGGQSLSGLARAFFYSGARSLLVSHWAVASQPTVVLTTSLFDAYTRDPAVGRASALRTAQLKLLADAATSHPSFWAPFVLVGDGGGAGGAP